MPQDRLTRPVKPIGHPVITTVEQAYAYMLGLSEKDALLTHWQHAMRLYMTTRDRRSPRAIAEFTDQFELALMLSWHLDLSAQPKRPPAPSIRAAHQRASQPARRRADRR
jgi:hypothetical protein